MADDSHDEVLFVVAAAAAATVSVGWHPKGHLQQKIIMVTSIADGLTVIIRNIERVQ
jgi:hypothetical protein